MKVFAAALPFLILAAALGPQTHGLAPDELGVTIHEPHRPMIRHEGVHRPTDCCFSFTPRSIRCKIMESYYETSSECPLPAVIFITKRGQQVCADPHSRSVQNCLEKLNSDNAWKTVS